MKRSITFFVATIVATVSLLASDADILAMLQANSDAEIISFVNDADNPYTLVGKDSLQGSSKPIISITYQSDWVVQLSYTNRPYADLYMDDIQIMDVDSYLPAGTHTIRLEMTSSRTHYIVGLGVKHAYNDEQIRDSIQAKSNVKILNFVNDDLYPFFYQDGVLQTHWAYGSELDDEGNCISISQFTLSFRSDSISVLTFDGIGDWEAKSGIRCIIKGDTSDIVGPMYFHPGEYTITLLAENCWTVYLGNLSITAVCTDADLSSWASQKLGIAVQVENDPTYPWVVEGDSISHYSAVKNDVDSVGLTISFNLDSHSILSLATYFAGYSIDDYSYGSDSIRIDGLCHHIEEGDTLQMLLTPGAHTLRFIYTLMVNEGYKAYISKGVRAVFEAYLTHMALQPFAAGEILPTNIALPSARESYYDVDGDGQMEWFAGGDITAIDWAWRQSYIYKDNTKSGISWKNLNNDEWMDAYSVYTDDICSANAQYDMTVNAAYLLMTTVPIDYNNDGYPDLVSYQDEIAFADELEDDRAYTMYGDANHIVENRIQVQTLEEYNNIDRRIYRGSFTKYGTIATMPTGFSIIGGYAPVVKNLPNTNIDINGDGIEDYFEDGTLYTNLGNGTIVYQEFPEDVDFAELNGDGVLDAVAFDGSNVVIYFFMKDGTYTTQKIYASAQYSKLWCYDFDKDEDKDILLAFNYSTTLGGSYLILLENKGNNKYNSHEYYYANHFNFGYCVDFDHDGYYELISQDASLGDDKYSRPLCYFRIDGTNIDETPQYWDMVAQEISAHSEYYYQVADVDNDGIMEMSAYDKTYPYYYNYMLLSEQPNNKPQQPAAPTVLYEPSTGLLSIYWPLGEDTETSSVDLTYALRIGTESGLGDIVYAHALADGTRRNHIGGNQHTNRYKIIDTRTWKQGKYYIALQTVDANNRGSAFSEEVVFEKTTHAAAIELMYHHPFGVGDTCIVNLHPNVLLDATHTLHIEHANVVDTADNKLSYSVVFNQSGEHIIALHSRDAQGNILVVDEKWIEVAPMSIIDTVTTNTNECIEVAMDLDEDGYMEYYRDKKGFYSYQADGSNSKVNKMWNNNPYLTDVEYVQKDYAVDNNMDGMSDMFANYSVFNSKSWYTLTNMGNQSMSINTELINFDFSISDLLTMVDLNHDGYLDIVKYDGTLLQNSGDYRSFATMGKASDVFLLRELTNDGLVDYIARTTVVVDGNKYGLYTLHKNNGDFTFTCTDTLAYMNDVLSVIITGNSSLYCLEDFDNDGQLDWLYLEPSDGLYHMQWSDGSNTTLDDITSVLDLNLRYNNVLNWSIENQTVMDFNNDGYLDITYATGGKHDSEGILLFLPNHQYQFVEGIELQQESTPFLAASDRLRLGTQLIRTTNTKPLPPTQLTAAQTSQGVIISWQHSQDAETPAVRMRYNISVKRKGQTGDGAYLISPCNSTLNGVHVPSTLPLVHGNQFLVPTASIPAGEYEVQVQGVDLHYQESDFSEVYHLVVSESVAIDAPAATGVGRETTVSIVSNTDAAIDWCGGRVMDSIGNTYTLVWDSVGMKTITMGEYTHNIYVNALPDATFVLPSEVMQSATVNVHANYARQGQWHLSTDGGYHFLPISAMASVVDFASTHADSITLRFHEAGDYIVRHTIDLGFGEGICQQDVTVSDLHIAPEITAVSNVDGSYLIHWENSSFMPADVCGYRLYKETSVANVYRLIAETSIDSTTVVDASSAPNVQSSRYALSYITTYGESVMGTPHQGLHVMINRGVGSTWNLAWMKYEGRAVSQYRIWRGTTDRDLSMIAEISGNMTSYSDLMTEDSVNYYAVEVVFATYSSPLSQRHLLTSHRSTRNSNISPFSNIVSTTDAVQVTYVERIEVQGIDITPASLTTSSPLLTAHVYPYYASYKAVNWVIMQGADFAQINNQGILTIDGITNGDIVVRAYALDGSNVYGETTIHVSGFTNTFTITYWVDGEWYAEQQIQVGCPITLLDQPFKEGYTFSGWSYVPDSMPANNIDVYGTFSRGTALQYTSINNAATRKVLINNQLCIILPDGRIYNIMGEQINN